jgi:hypothetical protein
MKRSIDGSCDHHSESKAANGPRFCLPAPIMKLPLAILVPALPWIVSAHISRAHLKSRGRAVHTEHHKVGHGLKPSGFGHPNQDGIPYLAYPAMKTWTTVTVKTVYGGKITTTVTVTDNPTQATGSDTSAFSSLSRLFDPHAGTSRTTIVIATPSLAVQTGTVILQELFQFTTIVLFYSGSTITTMTIATPSLPGQLGTVLIELPLDTLQTTPMPKYPLSTGSTSVSTELSSRTSSVDSVNTHSQASLGSSQTPLLSGTSSFSSLVLPSSSTSSTPVTVSFAISTSIASSFEASHIASVLSSSLASTTPMVSMPPDSIISTLISELSTPISSIPSSSLDSSTPVASRPSESIISTPISEQSTPTPSPSPSPSPGCLTALPAVCQVPNSGLLAPVLLTVDTLACQLALNTLLTPNPAAICFANNLLSTITGQDFALCLATNVPLCP